MADVEAGAVALESVALRHAPLKALLHYVRSLLVLSGLVVALLGLYVATGAAMSALFKWQHATFLNERVGVVVELELQSTWLSLVVR